MEGAWPITDADPQTWTPVFQGSESWEMVDEPWGRSGPGQELERQEGYMLKKRKWPLKGWHKVRG